MQEIISSIVVYTGCATLALIIMLWGFGRAGKLAADALHEWAAAYRIVSILAMHGYLVRDRKDVVRLGAKAGAQIGDRIARMKEEAPDAYARMLSVAGLRERSQSLAHRLCCLAVVDADGGEAIAHTKVRLPGGHTTSGEHRLLNAAKVLVDELRIGDEDNRLAGAPVYVLRYEIIPCPTGGSDIDVAEFSILGEGGGA